MNFKKTGFILAIAVLIFGALAFFLLRQLKSSSETSSLSPVSRQTTPTKKLPSSTLKEYADPSGFIFNYPDDLSLLKNEITDDTFYADIKLTSKDVEGNLNLKIQDTKLTSAEEWFKEGKKAGTLGKQVQWGSLNGQSIEDNNGIIFAALDQGVLFTMEVSYGSQKDFWHAVANPILSSFVFGSETSGGSTAQTGGGAGDVVFEGEEVVE